MAIVQNPVIGQAKNSAGGMIFYNWKGKKCMRARPISVGNPNTPAQQVRRAMLAGITLFGRTLLTMIRFSFYQVSIGITEFNSFVKRNIELIDPTSGLPDPADRQYIQWSAGTLTKPEYTYAAPDGADEWSVAKIAQTASGDNKDSDKWIVVGWNTNTDEKFFFDTGMTRNTTGNFDFTMPNSGVLGYVWSFYVSDNGKLQSPTQQHSEP